MSKTYMQMSLRGELILRLEKELKAINIAFLSFPGDIYVLGDHDIVIVLNEPILPKQFKTIDGWVKSGFKLEILNTREKLLKFLLKL